MFNETFQKWLNSQDNSDEERALDSRMGAIMALIQEDTKKKQEAEQKLMDAALDADMMGYKVVPGIMGPKLVRKSDGDEDLAKYSIDMNTKETYDPKNPESVAAYRQKIIERYKNKK